MSAICGIVNFEGAPVNGDLLHKMAEAAALRGPNGVDCWIKGNAGLAYLAMHTTAGSVGQRQPLASIRSDVVLAADVRLDNRPDLVRTLTAKGLVQSKDATDAELIQAAYEAWGEGCAERIIGDFAFAVWDARAQRLVCARDPIGMRPLFYHRKGATLFFASTIASILAALGQRPPLNELLIVDFLCWRFERWVHETIYEGILRVPASCLLRAGPAGDEVRRYWDFGVQPKPNYKEDAEYVEQFGELFAEAVRCRLRSSTPVGIMVSGGLDSSSIACMAHELVEKQDPEVQQSIRLYTCAIEKFPAADERAYQRAVFDKCPYFPASVIAGDDFWGFREIAGNGVLRLDEPEVFPVRSMATALHREAHLSGCRVMLSGEGADQVLMGAAYWHVPLILDVEPSRMGSELRQFVRYHGWPSTLQGIFRPWLSATIKPCMPPRLLAKRQRSARLRTTPEWLSRDWRRRLADTETVLNHANPIPSRSASIIVQQLGSGWYTALLSCITSVAGAHGLKYRLPFLDRRVIDFLSVLSSRFQFADGLTKIILRQSMVGILPEAVRQRRTKATFSEMVDSGLRHEQRAQTSALLDAIISEHGQYFDVGRLRSVWQQYYDGSQLPNPGLLAPLLLQAWLQSNENPAVISDCRSSQSQG
jgi:asparagine synthase (glutamine-hydrolysing)